MTEDERRRGLYGSIGAGAGACLGSMVELTGIHNPWLRGVPAGIGGGLGAIVGMLVYGLVSWRERRVRGEA